MGTATSWRSHFAIAPCDTALFSILGPLTASSSAVASATSLCAPRNGQKRAGYSIISVADGIDADESAREAMEPRLAQPNQKNEGLASLSRARISRNAQGGGHSPKTQPESKTL